MAQCLVSGGAGFIGSHIVEMLVAKGHEVKVLDDLSSGSVKNLERVTKKITFIHGSITDPKIVAKTCTGIEYIFHEAAQISVQDSIKDPKKTMRINVDGTKNILDAAVKAGVRHLVFASSAAVYGNSPPLTEESPVDPISPYGASKLQAEQLILEYYRNHGLRGTCLRYFNVYGPRQSATSQYSGVIAKFIDCAKNSKPILIFGDGNQTRDFVFVKDVARANILAVEKPASAGLVLNIATGKQISLNDLVKTLNRLTNQNTKLIYGPARMGDIKYSYAKIDLAKKILGFEPSYTFEQGLKETIGG